jgi:hypothetical protein
MRFVDFLVANMFSRKLEEFVGSESKAGAAHLRRSYSDQGLAQNGPDPSTLILTKAKFVTQKIIRKRHKKITFIEKKSTGNHLPAGTYSIEVPNGQLDEEIKDRYRNLSVKVQAVTLSNDFCVVRSCLLVKILRSILHLKKNYSVSVIHRWYGTFHSEGVTGTVYE